MVLIESYSKAHDEVNIELFEQYLLRTGRVTQEGRPVVDLRLDTTADSLYKRMIQGVSGAASDILTGTIAFRRALREIDIRESSAQRRNPL